MRRSLGSSSRGSHHIIEDDEDNSSKLDQRRSSYLKDEGIEMKQKDVLRMEEVKLDEKETFPHLSDGDEVFKCKAPSLFSDTFISRPARTHSAKYPSVKPQVFFRKDEQRHAETQAWILGTASFDDAVRRIASYVRREDPRRLRSCKPEFRKPTGGEVSRKVRHQRPYQHDCHW